MGGPVLAESRKGNRERQSTADVYVHAGHPPYHAGRTDRRKTGGLDGGRYTAQADATPKSFETQHDGNNGTTTVFWIYEFTDSGLRLCKSTTETKPKEFSDSAGYETITLTRMEPEKDTEESPD